MVKKLVLQKAESYGMVTWTGVHFVHKERRVVNKIASDVWQHIKGKLFSRDFSLTIFDGDFTMS
jgi:hypothetical protein